MLVEGLRNPTVVRSSAALEAFAIGPMTLRDAFARAIDEGGTSQFKTDSRLAVVHAPPGQAFAPIRRIGGATGWYFGNPLWRLRGWIDSGLGGVGMPRGRRDPDDCVAGDIIDGWRVEASEPDRLLRLSAGLKLPGRGWLEFRVDPLGGGRVRFSARRRHSTRRELRADSIGSGYCHSMRSYSAACCGGSCRRASAARAVASRGDGRRPLRLPPQ